MNYVTPQSSPVPARCSQRRRQERAIRDLALYKALCQSKDLSSGVCPGLKANWPRIGQDPRLDTKCPFVGRKWSARTITYLRTRQKITVPKTRLMIPAQVQ